MPIRIRILFWLWNKKYKVWWRVTAVYVMSTNSLLSIAFTSQRNYFSIFKINFSSLSTILTSKTTVLFDSQKTTMKKRLTQCLLNVLCPWHLDSAQLRSKTGYRSGDRRFNLLPGFANDTNWFEFQPKLISNEWYCTMSVFSRFSDLTKVIINLL